jgi:hypothetical protein
MPGLLRLGATLMVVGFVATSLSAEELTRATPDFEALIQQLDANQFSERQAASEELSRAGSAAFPALEKAAQSESREASERAVDILETHLAGDDTETKQAARESLQRLADDPSSRAGRLADQVLNPPPSSMRTLRGGVIRPAVRVAGANIRVNAVPARFVKRVQVSNNNGVKEIQVEENGRKVKIIDDPKEGIELEVTEKKDGKEATEKFKAKDAAELKQKHPEAHKIYDEFKQNGGVQIQVGGAAPPAQRPAAVPQTKEQRRESIQRSLQVIDQHIEQLRRQFPDRPDVRRHIERLEAHRKEFEKLQAE